MPQVCTPPRSLCFRFLSRTLTPTPCALHKFYAYCCARSFIRPPKAIDEELKAAMKLHVVGVMIHGKESDNINLFAALPHLAGDSNLNCECIYRSLRKHYHERGMLPKLHIQVSPTRPQPLLFARSFKLTPPILCRMSSQTYPRAPRAYVLRSSTTPPTTRAVGSSASSPGSSSWATSRRSTSR